MRRVLLRRTGDPAEVLELAEAEAPQPGPGEVLVRLTARSVNPADLLVVRGQYGSGPAAPFVPGIEGTGVVAALGPDVAGPAPGTRVISYGRMGTWQECMAVPAEGLIAVPDGMEDAQAAQAVMNPLSAWLMIRERLRLGRGDWLLQTAAGSSLGRIVVQIARMDGIRTINVVRTRSHVAALEELGADEVVVSPDEDIADRVQRATGGKGVAAAIDAVGGSTAEAALASLGDGGALLVYGLLSGEPGRFGNGDMIFRRLRIEGFWLRQWFLSTGAAGRERVIAPLLEQIASGAIRLPVDASFDLADVRDAALRAGQSGRAGKVLLVG